MFIFMVSFFLTLFLASVFVILLKSNMNTESERMFFSPFECGFDSVSKTNWKVSVHFYKILIMFLIFDVEIVLLLPLPLLLENLSSFQLIFMVCIFFYILFFGLFSEWKDGMMGWQ